MLQRASELAGASHGAALAGVVHTQQVYLRARGGEIQQLEALVEQAIVPLRTAGAGVELAEARLWLAEALHLGGRGEEAEREANRALVFADEVAFYIFDGATGTVLYQHDDHVHGTAWEYPVIADVDRDGNAEIILGSTNHSGAGGWNGITVIGDASGSWAPSRTIWNQHAYHITNVNTDGSIPTTQQDNWVSWNNFRAGGTELGPSHWLADLQPFEPVICLDTCGYDQIDLYLLAGNGGLLDTASALVRLERVDGSPVLDALSGLVPGGGGAVLGPFTISATEWGTGTVSMVVDPNDVVAECHEDNNTLFLGPWPCP